MTDRLTSNGVKTKGFAALNCIDLSNPDVQRSVALLKQACLDSGFFNVINHGISEKFVDEVFAQSKKFFALPLSKKMRVFRSEKYRGYIPTLQEVLDYETNKKDHKEVYHMGAEVPGDDSTFPPNVWPPADMLPGWKDTMQRYHREAIEVVREIAKIIALALDLSSDFFDQSGMLNKPLANFRIIHYGGQVTDPMKEIPGTAAHTDFGLITLLATNDVKGLQICRDRNAKPQIWESVQPLKGAFIVNIGDLLERFSNCVFRSTLHRVIVDQDRYSIALFAAPNPDFVVECSPTCISEENPLKFAPIKCGEYINDRRKELRNGRQKDNKIEA